MVTLVTQTALADSGEPPAVAWHIYVHLETSAGRRYDIATAFFRYANSTGQTRARRVGDAWRTAAFYPASFTVVDETLRKAFTTSIAERAVGNAAGSSGTFDVHVADWQLSKRKETFALNARGNDVAVALTATPLKPRLAFEDVIAYPRLAVRAQVTLRGARMNARGFAWIDRTTAAGPRPASRFVIAYDDGRDLFVRFNAAGGDARSAHQGVLVRADGSIRPISAGSARVVNTARTKWLSDDTGILYPSLWELLAPGGIDLAVVPPLANQEIAAPGGSAFWCGTVDTERAPPPGGEFGRGFVEISGLRRRR